MLKSHWHVMVVLLVALLSGLNAFAQDNTNDEEPEWLLNTMKDALAVADGDVLSFRHPYGDVRIESADTDRIQVTAIAQYRSDDPRVPQMRLVKGEPVDGKASHQLIIEFAYLEIAENEAWDNRRIDVGLFIPEGLQLEIETVNGLIETKSLKARTSLKSLTGDIEYKGTADIKAHTERGDILAHIRQTGPSHLVELSTLTGDIRSLFLEGANAQINLVTRGPITTDYSIEIDRKVGSPLKMGKVQIGEGGSQVKLESTNGGIRLQGLIVPEKRPES